MRPWHLLTNAVATEMRQRIQQFKDEKLGAKKKEFVETVQTVDEETAEREIADAMDTSA